MLGDYRKEQREMTFIDMVLMFFIAIIAIPMLPFCVLYIFLILKTNKKENFVLLFGATLIVILWKRISLFLEQATTVTIALAKSIIHGGFAITAYQEYNFTSWVLLIAISSVIASCAVKRIRHNYKLEEVGINSLNREHRKAW